MRWQLRRQQEQRERAALAPDLHHSSGLRFMTRATRGCGAAQVRKGRGSVARPRRRPATGASVAGSPGGMDMVAGAP